MDRNYSQGRIQFFVKGGSKLIDDWGGGQEYTHLDKLQLIWIQQFQILFFNQIFFFLSFLRGVPTPGTPLGSAHDSVGFFFIFKPFFSLFAGLRYPQVWQIRNYGKKK